MVPPDDFPGVDANGEPLFDPDTYEKLKKAWELGREGRKHSTHMDPDIVKKAIEESRAVEEELKRLAEAAKKAEDARKKAAIAARHKWLMRLLILLLAIIIAWGCWRVWRAFNPPVVAVPTQQGQACTGDNQCRIPRVLVYETIWGCESSLTGALQAAARECATLVPHCTGNCPAGSVCRPGLAVDMIQQNPTALWCTTTMNFSCPCSCATAIVP